MSWVRLDDGYPDHPKVLPLSDAAFRLDVCAKCWASARGTDGLITRADLKVLVSKIQAPKRGSSLVLELVERKLWEPIEDGWKLHDWLDYNPSAAEKAKERAAAAERMRKRRQSKESVTPEHSTNNERTTGERSDEVREPRPDPSPNRTFGSKKIDASLGLNFLQALQALAEGLAPGCDLPTAFQAPRHASATALPMNAENGWRGVWAQLAAAEQPPAADDMQKLGRWWARGGGALCKKPRFVYLSSVERMTEWLASSRLWDGESDPTPKRDEPKAPLRPERAGPDIPDGMPDSEAMRRIRQRRLELEQEAQRSDEGGGK